MRGRADSGFEFTDELENPLHPAAVTGAFQLLAYLAGLPPIRLHDLRHGAATLLLAAGHDMKVVQETLGLSSITIAADTYTSVLPELARRSAEDVAALIRPAGQAPGKPGRRRRRANPASPAATAPRTPARPGGERDGQQQASRPRAAPGRPRLRAEPRQPAWLDLGTGQRTARVLRDPGGATLLCCLARPASACTRPSSGPVPRAL